MRSSFFVVELCDLPKWLCRGSSAPEQVALRLYPDEVAVQGVCAVPYLSFATSSRQSGFTGGSRSSQTKWLYRGLHSSVVELCDFIQTKCLHRESAQFRSRVMRLPPDRRSGCTEGMRSSAVELCDFIQTKSLCRWSAQFCRLALRSHPDDVAIQGVSSLP